MLIRIRRTKYFPQYDYYLIIIVFHILVLFLLSILLLVVLVLFDNIFPFSGSVGGNCCPIRVGVRLYRYYYKTFLIG